MTSASPSAQFLAMQDERRGSRLLVCYPPRVRARGSVVYVHPFAEEMNKSRRMAALQARALSQAGWCVVQVDLLGCGDSSGEFGDATWSDWVQDVVEVGRWAGTQGGGPLMLWGLRAGCLVAAEASRALDDAARLVFWQPATSGKTVLQQFLRLGLAAEIQGSGARGVAEGLRARLDRGQAVEVAGYTLSSALAWSLERAVLEPPPRPRAVAWLEVSNQPEAKLLPASAAAVERWRRAGHRVDARVVEGPAFWNTVEIEEAPALVPATLITVEEMQL